ncbi:PREDICTED: polyadenylate-binding protein, cytoplasmic and nuclear-like [Camelina sativa]|uniref:Polyadenylate-binding protein, cytoplasmic and nuclear-like n=1 Tax=Camelina sativa TaxID=90675 RepID=A0ABM1QR01_CAMSA|nr:PREDICTED: polyadenylate-binding protein, cytoplasmic and nuclear-like [Camelina sativa]
MHGGQVSLEVPKTAPHPPPRYKDYHVRESLPTEDDETPHDSVEFVSGLSSQTKISDIIDFFNDVGEVVHVRLIINQDSRHAGYGYVEFASPNAAKEALETKIGEYLHGGKIFLEVAKTAPYPPPKYCIDHKVGCTKTPFDKKVFRQKLRHLLILLRINFFKDVGEVVHVRLVVDNMGKHRGWGFVVFAASYEAVKALETKNAEYLHNSKIYLDVAKAAPCRPRPKYEEYLQRESLWIDEDEAVEGLVEIPNLVEAVSARKKTLFVSNFCNPRHRIIPKIIDFFKDVGEVVRVRLFVNHEGRHVSCCFVEFASANEAEKALDTKNGECLYSREIFLDVAEMAPYPFHPRYNLVEKLW